MIRLLKKVTPRKIRNLAHIVTRKKKKRNRIKFGFDLNKHCNLKCKGCDHFSCLAEEEYVNFEVLEKDLSRMKELFGDNIEQISLLGGEPLLNPHISDCCILVRKIFPTSNITIITNGTLLLNVNEDFWNVCKNYKITISVTKYPVSFDYDKAEALADSYGVDYQYQGDTSKEIKSMYCVPLDVEGKQNANLSYKMCTKANSCITLEDGKLYTCTLIPNIKTFNDHFGYNLEVSDDDGIDIYSNLSSDEILDRLSKPFPFCRYCNQLRYKTGIKWGTTSKSISEWT